MLRPTAADLLAAEGTIFSDPEVGDARRRRLLHGGRPVATVARYSDSRAVRWEVHAGGGAAGIAAESGDGIACVWAVLARLHVDSLGD